MRGRVSCRVAGTGVMGFVLGKIELSLLMRPRGRVREGSLADLCKLTALLLIRQAAQVPPHRPLNCGHGELVAVHT